jgi:molybdopterin synthase sulfur carrier subunit
VPHVFIPPQLRDLTEGRESLEVAAGSVGGVIEELEAQYPGIAGRLLKGDAIRPGLSVAVDGKVSSLGLRQKVASGSEVHFLPAIGGG